MKFMALLMDFCSERWCLKKTEKEDRKDRDMRGRVLRNNASEEKTEQILRVHVVRVCLVIFCGMPLSPRLWQAAVVLQQASKTAGLPAALIRGCLLGAGDKLAERVRKCTHYASVAAG